ncbi:MAG TPA: hypothetical protein DEX36_06390 [Glutamicibacter sp.]|nr:hypothetical protein AARI_02410 [Glutamicibacter arilaitensis Re117]HCH47533.1 hypothetical protein [Glutamicibacter sp.]HCM94559.1 hypothetical protein [Glutamicibacter sp.]
MNLEVIAADFSDEEVLGVAVGALVLADQRTDPMRLVVESLKSVSQLVGPARFNDISCET